MEKPVAISLNNISKTYKAKSKYPTHALKDLSAIINKDEITGLIGPNGAGKTTLLKIILGFLNSDKGTVKIFNEHPLHLSVRKKLGFQADMQFIAKSVNVESYLKINAHLSGVKDADTNIRYLMEAFHMTSSYKKSLQSLSRGMRQKIEIIQAFLGLPELLIFDEPTAFLDPPSVFELRDFIEEKRRDGITVLFSSHNLTEVEKICDRVLFINEGVLSGDYDMHTMEPGFLEEAFRKFRDERISL
ncbi:MAG: ATP-binding cassette domain-containing protein [Ignavibacteriae bacterium]|nr:ATP-binding cassette domain-containing protein [Ignavibacteriota bacterium]